MTQFKPMLAATTDGQNLTYPLLASPKLDGVRALIIDGVVMSRSLKPIPNKHVQKLFGRKQYNGLDGELIVGDPTAKDVYRQTSSGVMSIEGKPEVSYHVFDMITNPHWDFVDRLFLAEKASDACKALILPVPHRVISSKVELDEFEERLLHEGYEGVMLRDEAGLYKYGRSTLKQGWLLKLKRFSDSEALVIGIQELMHNTNEAVVNELGQRSRSLKKGGMEGRGTLGALHVQDTKTKVKFDIGTGFDQQTRDELWKNPPLGKLVKYKYFAGGVKDKPRFPVFLGFRDQKDL